MLRVCYYEVAGIFSVNRRILSKIHKKYQESSEIKDEKREGPRSKKVKGFPENCAKAIERIDNCATAISQIFNYNKVWIFLNFLEVSNKINSSSLYDVDSRSHMCKNLGFKIDLFLKILKSDELDVVCSNFPLVGDVSIKIFLQHTFEWKCSKDDEKPLPQSSILFVLN
ncbi:hypothetical protein RF11_01201 [Thelohanellus kitauei]|uniref:Uncharacterized protein n=1 Tax=Thelohanellus kitauei TaxID=669202 RepID=A0A0C2MQR4_THEKT|nr:hypothetical protein RF11_01201 [Thelohanellus kitauei]